MKIQPTVGRVLLFTALAGDPLFGQNTDGQPLAAMVAHVHDDGTVNVGVLDREGNNHSRQRVQIKQDDELLDLSDSTCYCEWMAYQRGQAASSDQVMSSLTKLEGEVAEMESHLNTFETDLRSAQSEVSKLASDVSSVQSKVDAMEQRGATAANSPAPT